jgi:methylmalonyl-CoA mutase
MLRLCLRAAAAAAPRAASFRGMQRACFSSPSSANVPLPASWVAAAAKETKISDVQGELTWYTAEGIDVKPVYTAADLAACSTYSSDELPGQFPYTRGPYASMYRSNSFP